MIEKLRICDWGAGIVEGVERNDSNEEGAEALAQSRREG